MSDNTAIEWADSSWPVVTGCTHISAGCDHCYAAKLTSGRLRHLPEYAGLAEHGRFNGIVRCLPDRLDWPLKWRKPRRIFVSDMADLFHDEVDDQFIVQVFAVMASAQRHTFQVLTKRHGRMRSLLSSPGFRTAVGRATMSRLLEGLPDFRAVDTWPLPNVWLGVSVESQQWADIRIPALLQTPAAVRFLSCEPLLGPVDLRTIPYRGDVQYYIDALSRRYRTSRDYEEGTDCSFGLAGLGRVDWVIAGGESGPGARPMLPEWARSLRDQCVGARVPFFFKQWGAWSPTGAVGVGGNDPRRGFVGSPVDEHGCYEEIARTSKKLAGRLLDGREWNEFPVAAKPVAA